MPISPRPNQQPYAPTPMAFRLLHQFERFLARHSPLGDPPVYKGSAHETEKIVR